MKKFTLSVIAITAFMLGLIWNVSNLQAVQDPQLYADTVHINLGEETSGDETDIAEEEARETLFKEIKKLDQTVLSIKNRYMEDIDTQELIKAGIRGMLQDLDRFSVLMERKSYERLMESTSGKYEGLGMEIDSRDDYITVVTPMEGMPAYKIGLQSGDKIISIDGESTYKMTTSDAAQLMRGPAGTSVTLTISRPGLAEPIDFDVERAVIELKSVNYYGIIDGTDIGYVRLSRFAEETSRELREAMNDLNDQGVESLIFDLRSNGGGLLQQAVETAELFIEEGKLVVYTRGKFAGSERRHYSKRLPIFPEKPLVILVNEGTASASEIVAGAIQDWDRGVVMGYPTYGKGLVQMVFPIGSDNEIALKLTTAKYYIPSGRCIQKEETAKKDTPHDAEFAEEEPAEEEAENDSLNITDREIYYTNSGRVVYGGGGILPDIELDEDRTMEPIEINLERQRLFFDYAVNYFVEHPELASDVKITDEIVADFKQYIESKEFEYKTSLEVSLEEIKEIVEEENKDSLFSPVLSDFAERVEAEKEADYIRSLDYIKRALKREIVSKIAGERGVYEEVILKTDPSIKAAIELLNDTNEYSRVLETGQNANRSSKAEAETDLVTE